MRITTSGETTFYGMEESYGSGEITMGCENDLWFVSSGPNFIGHITIDGQPTVYVLYDVSGNPLCGYPRTITYLGDGNFVFETDSLKIVYIGSIQSAFFSSLAGRARM